jgi:hypothetical protein
MKEHADPEASNKKKQKKKRDEEESDAEDVEGEEEVEDEDNEGNNDKHISLYKLSFESDKNFVVEGAEADDIGSFEEVDDDEADAFLKNQMGVLEEAGDEDIADLEDNGDSFEVRIRFFPYMRNASLFEPK